MDIIREMQETAAINAAVKDALNSVLGIEPLDAATAAGPPDMSLCSRSHQLLPFDPTGAGEKIPWPHVRYRHQWWPVPTMGDLEDMTHDDWCATPDDDEVEPDHPGSWLSILGLI